VCVCSKYMYFSLLPKVGERCGVRFVPGHGFYGAGAVASPETPNVLYESMYMLELPPGKYTPELGPSAYAEADPTWARSPAALASAAKSLAEPEAYDELATEAPPPGLMVSSP
jgi:hypothetical protein